MTQSMTCGAECCLAARGIGVKRHGKNLLADIDIALRPGEVFALLGPNGAGKSTLIKALSAEIAPSAGHVCLNERWLRHVPSRERARSIAVLPQQLELSFPFTGFEVALLGRIPHHSGAPELRDRAITWQALQAVDAEHLAARSYPTLSGGERARVQLARVLAQIWDEQPDAASRCPRYLLLDEPTAPLDIAHQIALMHTLREVAKQGIGVMLIVHDLNLAAAWADRIALLRDGRISAVGTPEQVMTRERMREVFDVSPHIVAHPEHGRPWMAF